MSTGTCLRFPISPGEKVVAFEDTRGRDPWEVAEVYRSAPRSRCSGSWMGLLIQEREDRRTAAALAGSGCQPAPLRQPSFWQACDWAFKVGFRGVEVYGAAAAALLLRKEHGAGNVTREMVAERMGLPVSSPACHMVARR